MPIAQASGRDADFKSRYLRRIARSPTRRVRAESVTQGAKKKRKMNNEDGCCRSALVIVAQDEKSNLGCNPPWPLTAGA